MATFNQVARQFFPDICAVVKPGGGSLAYPHCNLDLANPWKTPPICLNPPELNSFRGWIPDHEN